MLNSINIDSKNKMLIISFILAMATLAVFWQVNQYAFVNYDDPVYVTGNSHIQSGLTIEGLTWAFSTKYFNLWHPLVWLSFMLDYQLHGLNAGGYHVTNLIIHILSTLLLFRLFNRMTGAVWKSAFVAAFFALHPLHVESVAWIAERKDVLSAFFFVLTLYCYVYYTEKPDVKKYLLVLSFFICALMSKPMVVTLPVVMILLDYWPLGRLPSQNIVNSSNHLKPDYTQEGKRKRKNQKENQTDNAFSSNKQKLPENKIMGIVPLWQIKEKVPFFLLSAVIIIVNFYTSGNKVYKHFPLVSRLANAPVAFVAYLGKTLWPHDMAILYPFADQLPLWQVLCSVLLIVAVSAAVIFMARRSPYLFVGWFWFVITILPVIGIIQISTSAPFSMADRYHYLTSIGLAMMLVWGIPSLLPREPIYKKILFSIAIAFLLMLMVSTWRQCHYWKNSKELWSHALNVTKDNYVAHNNLGPILFDEGKTEEAMEHFKKAIELNRDYTDAYNNRGNIYAAQGQYDLAIKDYDETIKLSSDYTLAYNNRGTVYSDTGRYQRAIEDFNEAIRLQSGYIDAYNNRGIAYGRLGQFPRAIEDFTTAISLQSNNSEAYNNRGITYIMLNNAELGCRDLQRACESGNCRILEVARNKGTCH
jgi:protein O-mannosyl-transferase